MWEIKIEDCKSGPFQDASFAGDVRDSKSASGGVPCVFGSQKCLPISWMCQKQTAVPHSSAEPEIISPDAGLRMDGLTALQFGKCVSETSSTKPAEGILERHQCERVTPSHSHSGTCVF